MRKCIAHNKVKIIAPTYLLECALDYFSYIKSLHPIPFHEPRIELNVFYYVTRLAILKGCPLLSSGLNLTVRTLYEKNFDCTLDLVQFFFLRATVSKKKKSLKKFTEVDPRFLP